MEPRLGAFQGGQLWVQSFKIYKKFCLNLFDLFLYETILEVFVAFALYTAAVKPYFMIHDCSDQEPTTLC